MKGETLKFGIMLIGIFLLTACSTQTKNRSYNYYSTPSQYELNSSAITVRRGDTLYSIAKRYNHTLNELITLNNLRAPYTLRIGQTLRRPTVKTHVVAKKDTLYSISRRYNVDMKQLARLNRLAPPYRLAVGQHLSVPGQVARTVAKSSNIQSIKPTPKKSKYIWQKPKEKPKLTPQSKSKRYANNGKKTPPKIGSVPKRSQQAGYMWPVKGKVISDFGIKKNGIHNDGINIQAKYGSPVKAAENGVVVHVGNKIRAFGNLILVKHQWGWITAYAHNSSILVKTGQKVNRGQVIAKVGNSGSVSSPQLHFEMRQGSKAINPRKYLN